MTMKQILQPSSFLSESLIADDLVLAKILLQTATQVSHDAIYNDGASTKLRQVTENLVKMLLGYSPLKEYFASKEMNSMCAVANISRGDQGSIHYQTAVFVGPESWAVGADFVYKYSDFLSLSAQQIVDFQPIEIAEYCANIVDQLQQESVVDATA